MWYAAVSMVVGLLFMTYWRRLLMLYWYDVALLELDVLL